ncbi:MAG TPA: PspC domain-containing protein [Candidatus Anaerofilum excrementigallinarum]|nr:PspC domain-containing protein [Candidatus Anaerofilum excrementigallinarum]
MNGKQLFKSDANRVLCGVCGGIGEYLGIDPTIVRLVAVLLGLSGTGLLVYIIAALIIPSRPAGM